MHAPSAIKRNGLTDGIGRRWLHYSEVDSTNRIAALFANDPANHGLVITADSQTAGRGQYERRWTTPPGTSVLMSILLFPSPVFRRASILTAWAAVSVCELISEQTRLQPVIKWPNDVLLRGRKVCGILCEGSAARIIVGIGLNLNQSSEAFAALALPQATSLEIETGLTFDLHSTSELLIRQLDRHFRIDSSQLETMWKERIGLIGESISVEKMDGVELQGRLIDLRFDGVTIASNLGHNTILPPEAIRHMRRLL